MKTPFNLTNQRFGRLLALEPTRLGSAYAWRCQCDCGSIVVHKTVRLRKGLTRSCGCLRNELTGTRQRTHGRSGTNLYRIWCHMRFRCDKPTNKAFQDYGGRGITVCDRWRDFAAFAADMGPCPPQHSIDRINNDGNYEPSNCRWATRSQQASNTRANRILTHAGVTQTLQRWSEDRHLPVTTLWNRLRLGWTVARALDTPRLHKVTLSTTRT